MIHPKVSAVVPNFTAPDHFVRTSAGRYVCRLCPESSDGTRNTFKTDKAALAHEKSPGHVKCMEAAKDDPWGLGQPDWSSEAAKDTSWMTPDQLKDLEYRRRTEEIPVRVGQWQQGFFEFVQKGEMLSVDAPPKRRPTRRSAKSSTSTTMSDLTVIGDVDDSDEDHMAVRSRAMAKAKALRDKERAARAIVQATQEATTSPPTTIPSHVFAPSSMAFKPPIRPEDLAPNLIPKTSSPIAITPEMRDWMAKIASDHRFSPSQAQQMREFIQLPTDAKISMIQHSVGQVRALLFT